MTLFLQQRLLSCEMQMYVYCTMNDIIITAVLGCVVGHMTRKRCDFAVHESEVWTWLHRCNSHDEDHC